MPDETFSAKNEALMALNQTFKSTPDKWKQTQCLAYIAIIDLLFQMSRRLDRIPINDGVNK